MPWKLKATSDLERKVDKLKTVIVCLRRELENKQGAVGRLELLLRQRSERIDELNAKLEQSRQQIISLPSPPTSFNWPCVRAKAVDKSG